jgi:hypothetical protein
LGKGSQKSISDLINECYHQRSEREVISSLEELLKKTKSGMVSYELGHEHEKIGKKDEAMKYYEKAESLFKQTNYKNMARAAINNLIIEDLIAKKNKQKTK